MSTRWVKRIDMSIKIAALALVFTGALSGCSNSNSGNPVSSQDVSTVEGQVLGQQGLAKRSGVSSTNSGVVGVAVTLAQVQANGSLKTVSVSSVQTDANGRFSVNTDLSGVSDLVAVATNGTYSWEAVVSAQVAHGTTVKCQPLTDQTTVQAEVFARVVADGNSGEVATADIQLYVSSSVAEAVLGDESAIAELASALEAGSEAEVSAFTQLGASQTQLQTAAASRNQVQIALESSLYSAAGDSLGDYLALQAYYTGSVAAFVAAGIPLDTCAKAEQVFYGALVNAASGLSSSSAFALEQSASSIRAVLIGQAISADFSAGGGTQGQEVLVTAANDTLLAALEVSTTTSEMTAAFAAYHDAVLTQLEDMAGSSGAAVGSADSSINATGGAKSVLQSAVASASGTSAIVQAYFTYFDSVSTALKGVSGLSAAQLSAATAIVALIDSNI